MEWPAEAPVNLQFFAPSVRPAGARIPAHAARQVVGWRILARGLDRSGKLESGREWAESRLNTVIRVCVTDWK